MSFVVQNDDGTIDNANAYIEVVYADSYFSDRGITSWNGTTAEKEQAIVQATTYIDTRFAFIGRRKNAEQSTEWPRSHAYDSSSYLITGLPIQLKNACAEYALIARTGTLFVNPGYENSGRVLTSSRKKAGSVEKSQGYQAGSREIIRSYPQADFWMKGLIITTSSVARA
jgi:hypothetical protein